MSISADSGKAPDGPAACVTASLKPATSDSTTELKEIDVM
jgi:hypothetical protein